MAHMSWQPSYVEIGDLQRHFLPQHNNICDSNLNIESVQPLLPDFDLSFTWTDLPIQENHMYPTVTCGSKRSYDGNSSDNEIQPTKKLKTPDSLAVPELSHSPDPAVLPEIPVPEPRRRMSAEKINEQHPFACPFYKNNPIKYKNNRKLNCSTQTWTMHRLKEHIWRVHLKEVFRCDRCLAEFPADSDLMAHRWSSSEPCPLATMSTALGQNDDVDYYVDLDQRDKIKSRLRRKPDREKWEGIYRIIFRLGSDDWVPSPFPESPPARQSSPSPSRNNQTSGGGGDSSLRDFKTWLMEKKGKNRKDDGSTSIITTQPYNSTSSTDSAQDLDVEALLRLMGEFEAESAAARKDPTGKKSDKEDGYM